jgi:alkylated DNA repair protein (DNA oxidative demethylase)
MATDLLELMEPDGGRITLATDAVLLRGFATNAATELFGALKAIAAVAAFRNMVTPGGYTMSVAMTNAGTAGWVTDAKGYRYAPDDPLSGRPWPLMPASFLDLADRAAATAGFDGFVPDACLINRYAPGAKLSLHQDKNEKDFGAPIVSVSLGLPAKFLFGGLKRTDKLTRVELRHGDVVVWGRSARLAYHGIDTLKDGEHPLTGRRRYNLTFRKALA